MTEKPGIKALVVDDEQIVRDFLVRLLSFRKVQVTAVDEGAKAVELVKKERFDIAFLDVRMPKMDGLETFRALKEISPDTKYVMMTGYAVDDTLKKAEAEGAVVSLKKPFEIDQVIKLLSSLFEQELGKAMEFLIVDDEETILKFFKILLKDKKYNLDFAHSGEEAMSAINKKHYDLVFLDVCLSDMSGLELYLKLQKDKPRLNVILMTGMGEKSDMIAKMNIKTSLYKPFDINKIFSEINRVKGAIGK